MGTELYKAFSLFSPNELRNLRHESYSKIIISLSHTLGDKKCDLLFSLIYVTMCVDDVDLDDIYIELISRIGFQTLENILHTILEKIIEKDCNVFNNMNDICCVKTNSALMVVISKNFLIVFSSKTIKKVE